jgi:hypothetical protein
VSLASILFNFLPSHTNLALQFPVILALGSLKNPLAAFVELSSRGPRHFASPISLQWRSSSKTSLAPYTRQMSHFQVALTSL